MWEKYGYRGIRGWKFPNKSIVWDVVPKCVSCGVGGEVAVSTIKLLEDVKNKDVW